MPSKHTQSLLTLGMSFNLIPFDQQDMISKRLNVCWSLLHILLCNSTGVERYSNRMFHGGLYAVPAYFPVLMQQ